MTEQQPDASTDALADGLVERLGRLDDDAEAREPSSTHDGPAANGEYDPGQGSPHSGTHPIFRDMTRGTLGWEVFEQK